MNNEEAERKILAAFYGYKDIKKRKNKLIGKLNDVYVEIPEYHIDLNALRTIENCLTSSDKKYYAQVLIYNSVDLKYKSYKSGYLNEFNLNKKEILLFATPEEKVAALITVITK